MKAPESIAQQRQKEARVLKLFLACSLVGSLALHAIAVTTRVSHFWSPIAEVDEADTEIIVEAAPEPTPPEPPPPETAFVAPATPPEPQLALAPASPLAPTSQAPLKTGEDAPSNKPVAPTRDPISPMASTTGETNAPEKEGGGPITHPDGNGSGFGFANVPSGFNLFGKPNGNVKGTPDGTGTQTSTRQTPAEPARPAGTPPLTCLECPKPQYRGSEGSPRVIYDVAPDGQVINVRLRKSSGNAETDRETLETMSKWRFDPKSVPQGGRSNVRVKVTFEEEGSHFQRQNEQRRRTNDPQRAADEAKQRREAEQAAPPTTAVQEPSVKPDAAPAPARSLPVTKPTAPPLQPTTPAPEASPVPPPAPADGSLSNPSREAAVEPSPVEVPPTAP